MPSPFPGMDPFIEAQKWEGFHRVFIVELAHQLVARLRPRYEVDPEERIYVETTEDPKRCFVADVAVSKPEGTALPLESGASVAELEPRVYTVPMRMEVREPYLVLRRTHRQEVVAVIELLSPTNKRAGSDGRRTYLSKRQEILASAAHLVEIDLLLGGMRLPAVPALLPTTDYCVFVCRDDRRPEAEVYEWPLRRRLPRIPVPLAHDDPDAVIDLQAAFNAVYDRSGYDYSLRYQDALEIDLKPADAAWVAEVVAQQRSARG